MINDDNAFRRAQRFARDAKRSANRLLKERRVSENITEYGQKAHHLASQKFQDYGLERVVQPTLRAASKTHGFIAETASEVDERLEISEKVKDVAHTLEQDFIEPTKEYLSDAGIPSVAEKLGRYSVDRYGKARGVIKPYFAAESARELLENTQRELTTITACILQVRHQEAEDWHGQFGRVVSAKIAAAAGTFSLFGLVSAFGTAGTGTAIAGLSGAAANSATLAAIGSAVGGGMAAGAMVLSGFGVLVGMGAYKLLSSTAREYETLPDEDKRIVNTASLLAAAIQERLGEEDVALTPDEANQFLQSIAPFQRYLEDNQDDVCSRLDVKNAIAFRQHAVPDFKLVVVRDFKAYTQKLTSQIAEGAIGGAFYGLLSRTALDGSPEQALVLEALRRSSGDLRDASEAEISEYLHSLNPGQMQGVANNVKGIYHELRYVERYNAEHQDTFAVLHEATNHQGSDVQIKSNDTGEVLEEFQLKATDSVSYVKEHQFRYGNIDVKATTEVSERIEGVETSGFSNAGMTQKVDGTFDDLADNTITDRVIEAAEFSGLAAAGLEAINVLTGKSNVSDSGKRVVATSVSTSVATGITAFLFS